MRVRLRPRERQRRLCAAPHQPAAVLRVFPNHLSARRQVLRRQAAWRTVQTLRGLKRLRQAHADVRLATLLDLGQFAGR